MTWLTAFEAGLAPARPCPDRQEQIDDALAKCKPSERIKLLIRLTRYYYSANREELILGNRANAR